MVYFNNYLYDLKRPQLPEHPSTRPGATPTGLHPSGLPLPTPSTPMSGQGLLNRPPLWPSSILFVFLNNINIFILIISVCPSSSWSTRSLL